jgi:hypothetical protein
MAYPKTPLTNTAGSYLPPANFLQLADWRTVSHLCSDVDGGEGVPQGALLIDPNLRAVLNTASGMFESAILAGKKYTPADIMALPNGSAGQAAIYGMLSWVTMTLLWERRPSVAANPIIMQRAYEWLKAIEEGREILSFLQAAESGVMEVEPETIADVDRRDGITTICSGYFSRRANRWRRRFPIDF